MGNIKPWQWVVLAAAVVALGFSAYRIFFAPSKFPGLKDSVRMVDVKTGEIFRLPVKGLYIPAPHPETKELTLLPIDELEGGKVVVKERYRSALKNMPGGHAAVDGATGEIRSTQ